MTDRQRNERMDICDCRVAFVTENQFIKISSIHVQYVDIKHHSIVVFNKHIQSKEINISVILVIENIEIKQVYGFIINQFMKVLHMIVIFVLSVNIQTEIKFMKAHKICPFQRNTSM